MQKKEKDDLPRRFTDNFTQEQFSSIIDNASTSSLNDVHHQNIILPFELRLEKNYF